MDLELPLDEMESRLLLLSSIWQGRQFTDVLNGNSEEINGSIWPEAEQYLEPMLCSI